MAFDVYPAGQTAPLPVPPAGTGSASITERVGDYTAGLRAMFIRLLRVGAGADPTIFLKADAGAPTEVILNGSVAVITDGATEVGNALLTSEGGGLYSLVVVVVLDTGHAWQIQIHNNDGMNQQRYTWVVADKESETMQPWIDADSALFYDLLTGQKVPLSVKVRNFGTGPLTITDPTGSALGAVFKLTTVPGPIAHNSDADLTVECAGPVAAGTSSHIYDIASNDGTAKLAASHNRRVNLSATTRKLEVVLLLDASGSMGSKPDGDPAAATGDSRWRMAVTATSQVLDLLVAFGDGSGNFAIAAFPSAAPCPSSVVIQPATTIGAPAAQAAKILLDKNLPVGGTPMGHGIETCIGGLPNTYGQFEGGAAVELNRRWLLLLSDGAHNCPPPDPDKFFGPDDDDDAHPLSFKKKKISVMTVGYCTPGVSIYAPSHAQLIAIKDNSTNGLFYDGKADVDGIGVRKAFRKVVVVGLSPVSTVDPTVILTPAKREARRDILVGKHETKVAFIVDWGTADPERVRVELVTPNCELITPAVAKADPNIELAQDDRYVIYTFNAAYLAGAGSPRPRHGMWTLVMTLGEGGSEHVEYEVLFESALRMDASLDRGRYFAGEPMVLTARLTLGGLPLTGASVTAKLDAPSQFADNWLAGYDVTPAELSKAKELLGSDFDAISGKVMALKLRGLTFNNGPNAQTTALTDPDGDGLYSATFSQTATPGVYSSLVVAVGATPDGEFFRRETTVQTHIAVRPEPDYTLWTTVYTSAVVAGAVVLTAEVRVYPRDHFGNVYLVDAELPTDLTLTTKGATSSGELIGHLDGSYSSTLTFGAEERPVVTLGIGGAGVSDPHVIPSPAHLVYADIVVEMKPGAEADGTNDHRDPKLALGDVPTKGPEKFVSLGGFGSIMLGVKGREIVAADDHDVTVFVYPDIDLRPYSVEAVLPDGELIALGGSPGVTSSFSLGDAGVHSAVAVTITDTSGRTRNREMKPVATPGVSILGAGFGSMRASVYGRVSSVKLKLTWGEKPRDLDLHVSGPDDDEGRFHLYFANRTAPPVWFVSLDLDDTTAAGPETVTIGRYKGAFLPGEYRCWVHNFNKSSFGRSDAVVTVLVNDKPIAAYPVAEAEGDSDDDIWHVVDIAIGPDGKPVLTPIQAFSTGSQYTVL